MANKQDLPIVESVPLQQTAICARVKGSSTTAYRFSMPCAVRGESVLNGVLDAMLLILIRIKLTDSFSNSPVKFSAIRKLLRPVLGILFHRRLVRCALCTKVIVFLETMFFSAFLPR